MASQPLTQGLPAGLAADVEGCLREWEARDGTRRLWDGDATLWTGGDESRWLGWLRIIDRQRRESGALRRFADAIAGEGILHAVVLGMGGSSLCPEVLRETFGVVPGRPELFVLDSTDPAQIKSLEDRIDPGRTLFIVSSKSGTTLEPDIFKAYFFDRAVKALGAQRAGGRFVAITDPGSKLETEAARDRFRAVYPGEPSVGGRYSALSHFGMVPAAVMGLDVERLLDGAARMAAACGPGARAADNPGVALGAILGAAARRGLDKLTLLASPGLRDLGAWLEQLIAESTGKNGKAIIPVDRERPGPPEAYGGDRLFIHLRLDAAPDPEQDRAIKALERAGLPVIRVAVADIWALGAEFFRWEFATAVAGALLGINPFDQPDVEASKVATRALTEEYEATGALPAETPFASEGGLRLFADAANAAALRDKPAGASRPEPAGALGAHLRRLRPGDYFALLAYLPMTARNEDRLQAIRHRVRDVTRVATCLGFGPRFLHSTGQAYKGGPDSGVFLQLTCDDAVDLPVPGRRYSFGVVKAAQARGDFRVLAERGRRALRVHLGADVETGLRALDETLSGALASIGRRPE
jgi:transaldolase/glucose-6-phosphate isomerase